MENSDKDEISERLFNATVNLITVKVKNAEP